MLGKHILEFYSLFSSDSEYIVYYFKVKNAWLKKWL